MFIAEWIHQCTSDSSWKATLFLCHVRIFLQNCFVWKYLPFSFSNTSYKLCKVSFSKTFLQTPSKWKKFCLNISKIFQLTSYTRFRGNNFENTIWTDLNQLQMYLIQVDTKDNISPKLGNILLLFHDIFNQYEQF